MFEFIDKNVEQKECFMLDVSQSFLQQNFSKEKIHYLSNNDVILPFDSHINGKSLFIQSLHSSFDNHLSFTISPDSIWYIISYEIATHIRLNKEKYRELFTENEEKDEMCIRDDSLIYGNADNDWSRTFNLFREPIEEKVPKTTRDLLLIDFSTSTEVDRLAMLSIFMDMLQHYYSFTVMTKCGIPKIKVTGTDEDWNKIIKKIECFHEFFPELSKYTGTLYKTLDSLNYDIWTGEPSAEFWRFLYKKESRSGGDLITGWINNLFAYDYSRKTPVLKENFDCCRLGNFPTHISKVPFIWNYLGDKINMNLISGFLGNELNEDYMTPRLGFGISELI